MKTFQALALGVVVGLLLGVTAPAWATWTQGGSGTVATRAGSWCASPGTASVISTDDGWRSGGPTFDFNVTTIKLSGSSVNSNRQRGYVKFTPPTIPPGCTFQTATLTLTVPVGATGFNSSRVVEVRRITGGDWSEAAPPPASWVAPTAAVTDEATKATRAADLYKCASGPCPKTWNVTAIAAAWYSGSPAWGVEVRMFNDVSIGDLASPFCGTREGIAAVQPTLAVTYA